MASGWVPEVPTGAIVDETRVDCSRASGAVVVEKVYTAMSAFAGVTAGQWAAVAIGIMFVTIVVGLAIGTAWRRQGRSRDASLGRSRDLITEAVIVRRRGRVRSMLSPTRNR